MPLFLPRELLVVRLVVVRLMFGGLVVVRLGVRGLMKVRLMVGRISSKSRKSR